MTAENETFRQEQVSEAAAMLAAVKDQYQKVDRDRPEGPDWRAEYYKVEGLLLKFFMHMEPMNAGGVPGQDLESYSSKQLARILRAKPVTEEVVPVERQRPKS